jgi:glycosyltransferase involved in cell wall biosynthesis
VPDPAVLFVHNYYQQPGGEDSVLRAESAMLRAREHRVHEYLVHNADIDGMGKTALLKKTIWNTATTRDLGHRLDADRVQVAHFHNTFPLVSPAGYYAAKRRGVGVVQTLHNYRLLCPTANFFRDGELCEQCLGKAVPWPGVLHGCYRGSRATTSAVAAMLTVHRAIRTYARQVDVYIALTDFARRKFVEGGLPAEKIVVKPNFSDDPGIGRHDDGSVLFVGRLAREKGVEDLLNAWQRVVARRPGARLRILGDGPASSLKAGEHAGVEWLGWQPRARVIQYMQDAALLVFPSVQREGFPMTIVEAFATGLPVLTSNFESMTELVHDGQTGRFYRHADSQDLAVVLEQMLGDEAGLRALSRQARAEYDAKYTPARNYEQLMSIYAAAIDRAR